VYKELLGMRKQEINDDVILGVIEQSSAGGQAAQNRGGRVPHDHGPRGERARADDPCP
jgi:hypothetical protein